MYVLKKNLMIFFCALFSIGIVSCMDESERIQQLIEKWANKTEVIRANSQIASDTKKPYDYIVDEKKLTTFLPEGNVTFFSSNDLEGTTIGVLFLLRCIDEFKKEKSEATATQRTAVFLKGKSGCITS